MSNVIWNISFNELCQSAHIDEELVIEVVEYGIAEPVAGQSSQDWLFDSTNVHWLKKAIRLSRDMEIDWVAVAMVIELLKQKEALERENQQLQQQLSRFS